ncbi:hypothetical protein LMG27177_06176 [Paraburkholderia fynbosensis]|uniref:Uncharacterized protein n=1 Tax=Paraburkholderia fynbosensis TaxID=1200993 RepID=A0A6J5GXP2_9BURK|nr:hypothetical protein LMG27177_06176 [Paraburkholderia fynbosensis]
MDAIRTDIRRGRSLPPPAGAHHRAMGIGAALPLPVPIPPQPHSAPGSMHTDARSVRSSRRNRPVATPWRSVSGPFWRSRLRRRVGAYRFGKPQQCSDGAGHAGVFLPSNPSVQQHRQPRFFCNFQHVHFASPASHHIRHAARHVPGLLCPKCRLQPPYMSESTAKTARRWKREWLDPTVDYCSVHHTPLETLRHLLYAMRRTLQLLSGR